MLIGVWILMASLTTCTVTSVEYPGLLPPVDEDGDGVFTPEDCDDDDVRVFPGAVESCDGIDEDCDGLTDEGLITDGAGCRDPGAPVWPDIIETVHAYVVASEPWDPETEVYYTLCLTAEDDDCEPLRHGKYNDLRFDAIDVHSWDKRLAQSSFDRVELRPVPDASPPAGDGFTPSCAEVVLDGRTTWCEENLAPVTPTQGLVVPLDHSSAQPTCTRCGPAVVNGPMIGEVSTTTARIWWQTHATERSELRVVPAGEAFTGDPVAIRWPLAGQDFTTEVQVEGLEPDTDYIVEVWVDGETRQGSFTTSPEAAGTFRFGFGSCGKAYDVDGSATAPPYYTMPMLGAVAADAHDLFIMLGDNHYGDTSKLSTLRAQYRRARQIPERSAAFANMSVLATWDDHDFVGNNTDGLAPGKETALRVFDEYWANAPQQTGVEGVFSQARYADVDFFLLDVRYQRHVEGPDSFLGSVQTGWLLDALEASDAPFKIVASGGQLTTEASGDDSWGGHEAEQQALMAALVDREIEGVVFLSGDVHRSEFRLLPGAPGGYPVPELTSSPMSRPFVAGCYDDQSSNERRVCQRGENYVIRVDVDTTLPDPTLTATIVGLVTEGQPGVVDLDTWVIRRSELELRPNRSGWPDLDGDGYGDLVLGVADQSTDGIAGAGAVHVFPGTVVGSHTLGTELLTPADLGTSVTGGALGRSMALGPVLGDHDDLVLGAPGANAVRILAGGGVAGAVDVLAPAGAVSFGSALALGDVDGDGRVDLVVGDPGANRVHLYSNPVWTTPSQTLLGSDLATVDVEIVDLGHALAMGDFDGDGDPDLAVGAPDSTIEGDGAAGAVALYDAGAAGLVWQATLHQGLSDIPGGEEPGDAFGQTVAAGRLNNDPFADLVIGAAGETLGTTTASGYLSWLQGGPSGLDLPSATGISLNTIDTASPQVGDRLGSALVILDLDGDGLQEVVAGLPGRGAHGAVLMMPGFESGPDKDIGQVVDLGMAVFPEDLVIAGAGAALGAGDFDGDGLDDLVIGAPDSIVEGEIGAGSVVVAPGTADWPGIFFRWHQALIEVPGDVGAGDHLGASLP